jgi:hypothetical protein
MQTTVHSEKQMSPSAYTFLFIHRPPRSRANLHGAMPFSDVSTSVDFVASPASLLSHPIACVIGLSPVSLC